VWATANADRGLTVHVELPAFVGGARTAVRPLADNAVSFSVAPP